MYVILLLSADLRGAGRRRLKLLSIILLFFRDSSRRNEFPLSAKNKRKTDCNGGRGNEIDLETGGGAA